MLQEQIFTLSSKTETRLKIKGSVFLCISIPVNSVEECNSYLEKKRKEYYKATHVCYAYQFGKDNFRYSDAGEPSGTAGIRILNAIQHFKLFNILVIVVRWFGGVKLGVGPLGKAYYSSAFKNLDEANKIEQYAYKKMQVVSSFSDSSQVHHILSKTEIKNINTLYSDRVNMEFYVKLKDIIVIKESILQTCGKETIVSEIDDLKYL